MSQPSDETQPVPGMEADVEPGNDGSGTWASGARPVGGAEREEEQAGPPAAEDDPAVQQAVADDTSTSRFATVDEEDAGELAVPFREPDARETPEAAEDR